MHLMKNSSSLLHAWMSRWTPSSVLVAHEKWDSPFSDWRNSSVATFFSEQRSTYMSQVSFGHTVGIPPVWQTTCMVDWELSSTVTVLRRYNSSIPHHPRILLHVDRNWVGEQRATIKKNPSSFARSTHHFSWGGTWICIRQLKFLMFLLLVEVVTHAPLQPTSPSSPSRWHLGVVLSPVSVWSPRCTPEVSTLSIYYWTSGLSGLAHSASKSWQPRTSVVAKYSHYTYYQSFQLFYSLTCQSYMIDKDHHY